jgi:NADPH2:quinone reductase
VQITEFGGPEALRLTDVDEPVPPDGALLIDVDTAGINFADTHQAENSYLAEQELPLVPGSEVVGRVRRGADADTGLGGRRVLALLGGSGGYAEAAVAHPSVTFPLPDELSDATALALLVQGTTAWHLLRTITHFQAGESLVVHAAAGGVGHLAVQLARAWGAGRIIGTASTPEKRALVESLGADVAIDVSGAQDAREVAAALRAANHGQPVDVVLEMTGGPVFDGSLRAVAPLGRLAVFGLASRASPSPIEVAQLMGRSQTVSGFWLVHALGLPGGLAPALEELTSMVRAGRLTAITGGRYPLDGARSAHEALRSRATIGKLVLDVSGRGVTATSRAPGEGEVSADQVAELAP